MKIFHKVLVLFVVNKYYRPNKTSLNLNQALEVKFCRVLSSLQTMIAFLLSYKIMIYKRDKENLVYPFIPVAN